MVRTGAVTSSVFTDFRSNSDADIRDPTSASSAHWRSSAGVFRVSRRCCIQSSMGSPPRWCLDTNARNDAGRTLPADAKWALVNAPEGV